MAIREVAKKLKDKFDFFIVTSRFDKKLPKIEKVFEGTIVRLGFGNRLDKYLLMPLGFFWALRRPGILFGLDISAGSMIPAVIKLFFPRRFFVLNIQYGYGDERLKKGRLGLMNLGFRIMLSQADFVAAISKYLLETARKHGYKGKAEVISNGVDLQNTHQVIRSGAPLDDGTKSKTIITVSRLVPKNGVDILIKAIAEVKKSIPDIRCLILGDGPEKEKLELVTKDYGLWTDIEFLGNIPNEKIYEHLSKSDVFVRPSRSEGMGNAFLEALSAGIPIIGTPVGGIPDIIEDRKTGLFCEVENPKDLAEKILLLLHNENLSQKIVENGQKMIKERFLWNGIVVKYENLFNLAQNPKILIATGIFPPDIGGPAIYSKLLLEELPKQGIDVKVLSFGSVRHLPKIICHLAYGMRLMTCGRSADIIFAQDPVSVGFPAAVVSGLLRKKFLLKVVGDYAWEQWQQSRKGQGARGKFVTPDDFQNQKFNFITELRRKIQKFVARRAKLIVTPSNYLKKIVSMWDILPDKISVVYNAFESPKLNMSKEEARKKLGLFGHILVSAGRNVPWKGFQTLKDLMVEIKQQIPNAKLFVFHNEPRENLLLYIRASDIFVLNTAYEGFSHQILEAMALGVPVITTNIGGNPEIMRDHENGFLVGFNDKEALKNKIIELLNNKNLAENFSEKSKATASQFTKEKMINKTIKILQSL